MKQEPNTEVLDVGPTYCILVLLISIRLGGAHNTSVQIKKLHISSRNAA